jgi:hypothetical protein
MAVALVGIALAIIKPWDVGGRTGADVSSETAPPLVSSTGWPSPSARQTPWVSLVARSWQCYYASDWRVFALGAPTDLLDGVEAATSPSPTVAEGLSGAPSQRDLLNPVRTWIQTEPLADAVDPMDPRIPFVRIVHDAIPALGYCAPTSEPDRPPRGAQTSAWSLAEDGSAVTVGLRAIAGPAAPGDSTEGLFVPDVPGSASVTEWIAGRYVFAVRDQTPSGYSRWFGVEIINPPGPFRSTSP